MQRTASDPMIGRHVDGRYEVTARIARGGMATVYRAQDRRLDRTVALKVMHPHLADSADFVARFRREARSAARLTHPGIVAIYDQGYADDASYLTMQYVAGPNLRTVLREAGALPLGKALELIAGVLDALGCAHRAGLVHRDVKPENVLLGPGGKPMVTDFGLARAVTEATAAATGQVLGTVAYLAPEIVTSGVADMRADVYATGIMLFELITGSQPFVGDVPIRVAFQHVNESVPRPSAREPWLPAEVDELVTAMTQTDPVDRPADADHALELLRRVEAALDPATLARRADVAPAPPPVDHDDGDVTTATPVSGTVALPIGAIPVPDPGAAELATARTRRRRRRRIFSMTALLLIIGIGAGGTWWWFNEGPGAYTQVPQLLGLPEDQAVQLLAAAGLAPELERDHHDTAPQGEVFASRPAPGEPVRTDGTVVVQVSRGILMVEVPPLAELTEDEALAALEDAGLTVGEISRPWADDVAEGTVMSSAPAAAETVPHNEPVDLEISAGREPVELVSVVGAEQATAESDLEDAGLTAAVSEEYSDSVVAGRVVRQDPAPGDDVQLYRGDTVDVVVSLGPEPIALPDVVGEQIGSAREELEAAGFVVDDQRLLGGIFGTVHSMSPSAGELAVPGSTVTLRYV
ncbi:Stk1 family PASTA domain-containing Ser/Thr kinase [Georgenia sp. MJ170]|uniref:Stk1 family PASTA domain-containing Ser/Thr kinase n=1 Tax=Georgenia sunbinii TaxID=3117728 RepID=UPI002F26BE29